MTSLDLWVRNVKLTDRETPVDIAIRDGVIRTIGPVSVSSAGRTLDAEGHLALPPFVEPHTHLDTALTAGEPRWNRSGSLFEGIEIWSERRASLTHEEVTRRARKLLTWYVANGVLYVRGCVDVSDPELTALRAVLELREQMDPWLDLQIVAFPQQGLDDPQHRDLLQQAVELGVDAVGAIPHIEPTPEAAVASLDVCVDLADRYDRAVHVFCDEIDDPGSRSLERVADRARTTGLGEQTVASHAIALSHYPDAYAAKVIDLVHRSGISVVAAPLVNCALQSRFSSYPKPRGLTRVKELDEAGVNVALAHDDVLSPFYPLGTAHPLEASFMAAHLDHMTGRTQLENLIDMVTVNGARALGAHEEYGIREGTPADLVVLPASDRVDALRRRPHCRWVIRRGQVVAECEPSAPQVSLEGGPEDIEFQR